MLASMSDERLWDGKPCGAGLNKLMLGVDRLVEELLRPTCLALRLPWAYFLPVADLHAKGERWLVS